nr:unnamed protein product [Digitaria exilis]
MTMTNSMVSAAVSVVGKALDLLTNPLLKNWAASVNLGLNVEALQIELLTVQALLEHTSRKEVVDNTALSDLLLRLQDMAYDAEDVLDELDYFRIQDQLHGTSDAAEEHAKGWAYNLALHAKASSWRGQWIHGKAQEFQSFLQPHPRPNKLDEKHDAGAEEILEEGLLLVPPQLQALRIFDCPELILHYSNPLDDNKQCGQTGGGGLQGCPKLLFSYSSYLPFPKSLDYLLLADVMETLGETALGQERQQSLAS